MKRKLITTILTLSLCLSCFTACSFNAKKVSDNIGKGNESDLPEAEDVVIDDKDDMYIRQPHTPVKYPLLYMYYPLHF